MFKQSLILNTLLLVLASFFITSCEKENLNLEDETLTENFEGDFLKDMPYRQRCFRLQFPITVNFDNGSSATVVSKIALHKLWKEWKENSGPDAERPQFAFPYDVKLKDGSIVTVENREDVQALLEECDIPGKLRKCFSLNYPVTVQFSGGSTLTASNAATLKTVIREWREDNPDALPEDYPDLVFPYEVTLKTGRVVTIENEEDQKELRETCGELWSRWKCFKMVFPLEIAIPNGDTVELSGPRALRKAIKRWKENHPSTDQHPTIVYPIDIELSNGEIITINNREQLKTYMDKCTDIYGKRKCYKLAFPATVDFPDGTSLEAEDRDQLHQFLRDWKHDNPDATDRPSLAYPYDVILHNGDMKTIANDEDKEALKDYCN